MQLNSSNFLYQVLNRQGAIVMQTKNSTCRYPSETELSMLECGMTIKMNGKKLTRTEVKKQLY